MSFTVATKIRFDDVDGAGIVYYPHFFHLCHQAFEDLFDDVSSLSYPELIGVRRLGFPTVAIQSEFHAPLAYGDTAVVKITVRKIGRTSLVCHYDIFRKKDGRHAFEAEITTVLIDLQNQKPLPLTDELRAIFSRFLGDASNRNSGIA